MENHKNFMEQALEEAEKAYSIGEVPIGGIIMYEDKIIARAYNIKESSMDSTNHAEMILIKEASKYLNNWRLNGCTMYVTLEPCPMCAGAIIQSRISNLVYAAKNLIYGSMGTVISLQEYYPDAKNLNIINGILEEDSVKLMKNFFRKDLLKFK